MQVRNLTTVPNYSTIPRDVTGVLFRKKHKPLIM